MKNVQVAPIIRAFACPLFYFSTIKSINNLSTVTLQAAAHKHRVARAVSLTPHHFDDEGYKSGPVKVNHEKIREHVIRLLFYAPSIYAAIQ
jgi:hypothetical protein